MGKIVQCKEEQLHASTEKCKCKTQNGGETCLSHMRSTRLRGYRIKPVDFCVSNNPRWIYRARNKQKPGLFDKDSGTV